MIILDTDHLSAMQFDETDAAARLSQRLGQVDPRSIATTIVSAEEQMRGWLAAIHGRNTASEQVIFYERLRLLFRFFADWNVLPFDQAAAIRFDELRKQKL